MARMLAVTSILGAFLVNDVYLQQPRKLSSYGYYASLMFSCLLPFAILYRILLAPRFSKLRGIPTAPQPPLTQRLLQEPNSEDFLRWIEEVPNDGLLRYFGAFNGERILVTTTEGTKIIHEGDTRDFRRPPAAKAILCRLTGGGIFAAEGTEHAAQRKEMQPAFKFRHLKDLYPTFWAKTTELVKSLDDWCAGSPKTVEIDDWVSRGTLDAIALAGFGMDFNAIAEPRSELVTKYRTAFLPGKSAARIRILANIMPIKILFSLPMKRNRDAKACIQTVRAAIRHHVKQRQVERMDEKKTHNDLLSVLMQSPKFTQTDDVVSQCMAFLAAGHEASALALGWTLLELSKNPETQRKLRDEIRANLPSPGSGESITADQVDHLPYLEAVVKESLRFWGPVPRQTRSPVKPVTVSDVVIPPNTPLAVSFYAMNRSTRNWGPDAAKFVPERWLGSNEAKAYGGSRDRFSFSTFSHGARSCIGQKFAHYEILVFLAGLVGRFDWSFVADKGEVVADHDSTVMLKVSGGLQLSARAVKGW